MHASSAPPLSTAQIEPSPPPSSSSSSSLPDRKTFIAALGGGAFFIGLTGATLYGLRKARAQALKEAQQAAQAAFQPSSSAPSAIATATAASSYDAALKASTTASGAFTTTIAAPTSVFDDAANSSLPGVLRRRATPSPTPSPPSPPLTPSRIAPTVASPPHPSSSSSSSPSSSIATAASTLSTPPSDSIIDYSEMDSTLDFLGLSTPQPRNASPQQPDQSDYHPTSFGDTPVGLSLKAFTIATAIVLGSAAVAVETTRRVLGVDSLDEFVLKMSTIVPSRSSGARALGGISPALRTTSDATTPSAAMVHGDGAKPKPLSVSDAIEALSQSTSIEAWFKTLKMQLDAERDEEVARRFHSLEAYHASASAAPARRNDSVSPSFDIHSPLEDFSSQPRPWQAALSKYTFSISPLLPMSAFGFGFVSGLTSAGKRASLVFMAENAHRLPDTVQGWYFYSKTKNYRILLRGIQGGLKQGLRLSIWTTGFCVAERLAELSRTSLGDMLTSLRSDRDAAKVQKRLPSHTDAAVTTEEAAVQAALSASTWLGHWTDGMVAGLVTASAAVSLYSLTKTPRIRVLQLGILAGGLTGGLRDAQERILHKEIGGVANHT
ncbi:hypothetical protein ACQY0O_004327 [Thecaphora frezii]